MAIVEQQVQRIVSGLMKDERWVRLLSTVLTRLQSGSYDPGWVDAVFQKWDRFSTVDMGDAYCFALVWTSMVSGDFAHLRIDLGQVPCADRIIERNSAAVSQIGDPFVGEFWGGLADSDGYIEWTKPVQAWNTKQKRFITIKPMRVPLEVGYTTAGCTLCHLRGERGLARWPYKSEAIWIWAQINNSCWRPPSLPILERGLFEGRAYGQ